MAWRDSRRNRMRLLLFISSIVIGIAALVAINSFGENLETDIDKESNKLLGADLVVEGRYPMPDSLNAILQPFEAEHTEAINFASMVLIPKNGGTRLVQIKGIEGNYPYYGIVETVPASAYASFQDGQNALVEKTLMVQFGLVPGDEIKVGKVVFNIAGQLNAAPGRTGFAGSIAPVVFVPKRYISETGLVQLGSRVEYQYYYKMQEDVDLAQVVQDTLAKSIRAASLSFDTAEDRKQGFANAYKNLNNFLNLIGFIALLLGCIGVASAVHIYIKSKLPTVAVLRTLGTSGRQAFLIYLLQIAVMGLIGAILGALLGSVLQKLLPTVLGEFLPLENVSTAISTKAVLQGVITGLAVAVLFALLPLLGIRKISPLQTLRASYEESTGATDPYRWLVIALIAVFIGGFAWFQTGDWKVAGAFIGVVAVSFLLLAAVARLIMWLVRRFFPVKWSYIWRQGLANLYRPNNQTLILMVSIGLGTALISTLFFTQDLLLGQVEFTGRNEQPNMILYDIQTDQKEAVAQLTKDNGLPLLQQVPIVTMRMNTIDGIDKMQNAADTTETRKRGWVFRREYRVTYRDTLIETEKVVEGEWHGEKPKDDKVYISISTNLAEDMKVEIGAKLIFNVQGAMVETEVSSIREIDFSRIQTNFFVVFPTGVLESAPQFHVVITRTPDETSSGNFQRDLVSAFPNVSAIDLTQILKTVNTILDKISFVIKFMALFSVLTGILVLISSVVLSKYQRVKESVLLRTLGANRSQILRINAVEYFLLGALASLTGIFLSFGISWLIATYQFEIPFRPKIGPPFWVFLSITVLTVIIGLLNSRDVVSRPPLEVLRREV